MKKQEIKIVVLSDTHTQHRSIKYLPDGDVLVFAGDLMNSGNDARDIADFANWFESQPHQFKCLIAGNHDRLFESHETYALSFFNGKNFHYLKDSSVEIMGWKFWGSPYQPEFFNWAFNCQRGADIRQHWDKIPLDTDILITHGPPLGIGDKTGSLYDNGVWTDAHIGDADLLEAIRRVNPELHICGHIHNGRGLYPPSKSDQPDWKEGYRTCVANVSICDESYEPNGQPFSYWLAERE